MTITADVTYVDTVMKWRSQMNRWSVTLHNGDRSMTVDFYTGIGLSGEPTAESVLECLLSDASTFEDCGHDPDAWVREFGPPESITQLLADIKATARQTGNLRDLLGDEYEARLYGDRP